MPPAKKTTTRPTKGETWVRRRDRFLADVDAVTRTRITVCVRCALLIYTYSHTAFHKNFRWPHTDIRPGDLFEREKST